MNCPKLTALCSFCSYTCKFFLIFVLNLFFEVCPAPGKVKNEEVTLKHKKYTTLKDSIQTDIVDVNIPLRVLKTSDQS